MTTISGPPGEAPSDDEPLDESVFAADETLAFDISSSDGTAHVRLTGAVVEVTASELSIVLDGLIRGGHRRLAVDLAQLRPMGRAGAAVLNRTAADLRGVGGRLTLVNVPGEAVALLELSGLSPDVVVNPPREGG